MKDIVKVPFGKYKDKEIQEMLSDDSYISWLKDQVWVKDKYPIIFNIIQQINLGDQPTPEHNKMQIKFLDNDYLENFLKIYFEKIYSVPWYTDQENDLSEIRVWKVLFEEDGYDVVIHVESSIFIKLTKNTECDCNCFDKFKSGLKNKDHRKSCKYFGFISAYVSTRITKKEYLKLLRKEAYEGVIEIREMIHVVMIELKTLISDDYPTILRKIKKLPEKLHREYKNVAYRKVVIAQNFESEATSMDQVRSYFETSFIHFLLESEFNADRQDKRITNISD